MYTYQTTTMGSKLKIGEPFNNSTLVKSEELPGKTLSGWFFSKLRTKALAVILKICLGVKFTPSLT